MVLRFLVYLILLAPLSGWGFSADLASNYQEKIKSQKLWRDPQWLKLGHYRVGLFGAQSPLQGNFFLSQKSNDPEAELLATVNAFFISSESAQQHQCRYLGRKNWLKNKLNISAVDFVHCPERDRWKQQLNATEVYMVFASSDLGSAGSSLGHTFLRLHNSKNIKNLEILDYGINYAAVTDKDNGALYALKGLFGFYSGAYSMLPYYQKIKEYTNLEGRNLWEYRIDFSATEVEFLIDHLLELDGSFAPYYFANDNCSQQLMELLEVVKPDANLTSTYRDFVIPLDTIKTLKEKNLLQDEFFRLSLQAEWRVRFKELNHQQKTSLREWVRHQKFTDLQNLSRQEQAHVLEATSSYLAIKEYRGDSVFAAEKYKEQKYFLAQQRAALGAITEPVTISKPESPLLSPSAQRFYLSVGRFNEKDFYAFKYRRSFHDLLSVDSGLVPFSHLEVISFDFRYFRENENLDLYRFIFLKSLSTAPINVLDKPLSWNLEIGTEPKLFPYLNFGIGYSIDFSFLELTRFTLLGISENSQLTETARSHLGLEALVMSKAPWGRGFASVKALQNAATGRALFDVSFGFSKSLGKRELRLEGRSRDTLPEILASIVF